jgi:hypothetical protein
MHIEPCMAVLKRFSPYYSAYEHDRNIIVKIGPVFQKVTANPSLPAIRNKFAVSVRALGQPGTCGESRALSSHAEAVSFSQTRNNSLAPQACASQPRCLWG